MNRNPLFPLALLFLLTVVCAVGTRAACSVTVTTTTDSSAPGSGSLRAAIIFANSNPGLDVICFNIPGPGVHTIQPGSPGLPPISQPVSMDGALAIEINGAFSGFSNGLNLNAGASGSTIRGLIINGFQRSQISVNGSSG